MIEGICRVMYLSEMVYGEKNILKETKIHSDLIYFAFLSFSAFYLHILVVLYTFWFDINYDMATEVEDFIDKMD
jgi:hypothetical protein